MLLQVLGHSPEFPGGGKVTASHHFDSSISQISGDLSHERQKGQP
jgi:hypothetical protein